MKKLLFACLLLFCIFNVRAADPVLTIDSITGKLTGALGVTVEGALYDVVFTDSGNTCSTLFGGCDMASDFAFTSSTAATHASLALLGAVLLDGSDGSFDSVPSMTEGCSISLWCDFYTPFSVYRDEIGGVLYDVVTVAVARNKSPTFGPDTTGYTSLFSVSSFLDDSVTDRTWAVWSPSHVVAVPEPEIYAMMGIGLGLLGWVGRRKKLQAAA